MAQRQELTRYQMVTLAIFLVATLPFAAAVVRGIVKTINYTSPVYTVTINSVGSLDDDDPTTVAVVLAAPVSLAFKLTLRIDERTGRRTACLGHRAVVAVDYQGAVLGRGPAPPELCVDDGSGVAEAQVTAWGTGVEIPAFLRDQLREELRLGEAAFGVSVLVPSKRTADPDVVYECRGKVGEESAPCTITYVSAGDRDATFYYLFPIG